MKIELIALISISVLVSITAAHANHQDKHITIEVKVNDANPDDRHAIYIGIPEMVEQTYIISTTMRWEYMVLILKPIHTTLTFTISN